MMLMVFQSIINGFALFGMLCAVKMFVWRFKVKPKYDRANALMDLARREQGLWASKILTDPEGAKLHRDYAEEIYLQYQKIAKELGIE